MLFKEFWARALVADFSLLEDSQLDERPMRRRREEKGASPKTDIPSSPNS